MSRWKELLPVNLCAILALVIVFQFFHKPMQRSSVDSSTSELIDLTCWLSEEHPEVYEEWQLIQEEGERE